MLQPLIAGTKIDTNTVHCNHVPPVLVYVVALKFHNEQTSATGIAPPKAWHSCFHRNLANIEVRAGRGYFIPW
ncbi:hypothetical protein VAWG003_26270 [Aeromonas dhakensis]|nr:hypothetical protein VAWG003_26270 [Aeromonas dhakensis]